MLGKPPIIGDAEREVEWEGVASADLPLVLADFAISHPKVRLHVRCDLTLHLVEQFEAGAFDMILIKQDPERIMPGAKLLRQEQLCWVGARKLANLAPAPLVPLVLAPAPCVYCARAIEALSAAGLGADVVYASPSEAGQVAAVRAGLGIGVLPRSRVPADLAAAKDGWPPLRDAAICLMATTRRTGALEAFFGHVEARLRPAAANGFAG